MSPFGQQPVDPGVSQLLAAGTVDAELAATVGLLVAGRCPLIVAGEHPDAEATATALLESISTDIRTIRLDGVDEGFDWMPQATELGWRRSTGDPAPSGGALSRIDPPVRPDDTVVFADLSSDDPTPRWGEVIRIAVRAASIGYGLVATVAAGSLDDVFTALRRPPVGLRDDELSHLGVVLIQRRVGPGSSPRVVAAHYVRPIARDEHGHVQRLGPAVLATWDPSTDAFEHFGWGIAPELARRVRMKAGDFEAAVADRRILLGDPTG